LSGCLEALVKSCLPSEHYEVIVVDDGSPSDVQAVAARFQNPCQLQYLRQENRGPAAARNAGAAIARGEFLAFTDDDCRPDPTWLFRLESRLRGNPDVMVGGRTVNALVSNAYSQASQLILDVVYRYYNQQGGQARFFASNNVALARDQFLELGGFDTGFTRAAAEDRDFCDRWSHRGWKLVYEPEAVVNHAHALNLFRFCKQHFDYGRGAYRYHELRAHRQSGRMWDDTRMHVQLPGLLREPLDSLSIPQRCQVVPLLALWQVANALGFFRERIVRQRPRHPQALPQAAVKKAPLDVTPGHDKESILGPCPRLR